MEVGELLWAWNGVDTSQFESTAFTHERDLGTATPNANTAMALSVVDRSASKLPDTLRVTGTSVQGGGVFAVLTSEITLPDRCMVEVTFADQDAGAAFVFGIYPYFNPDVSGNFEGYLVGRFIGSSSARVEAIVNGLPGTSESLSTAGIFSAATTVPRGGIRSILEVYRQRTADDPALSRINFEDRRWDSSTSNRVTDGTLPHTIASVGTNHDGVNMTRIGFGGWEGVNGSNGTFEISSFKIFAHPED